MKIGKARSTFRACSNNTRSRCKSHEITFSFRSECRSARGVFAIGSVYRHDDTSTARSINIIALVNGSDVKYRSRSDGFWRRSLRGSLRERASERASAFTRSLARPLTPTSLLQRQVISASSRADQTRIRRIRCNKFTVPLPIDLALSRCAVRDGRNLRSVA